MKCDKLLVTTDFSDCARMAYAAAAALARQFQAELHLVHVAEPLPPHYYLNLEGVGTDVPTGSYYDGLKEKLTGETAGETTFDGLEVKTELLLGTAPHQGLFRYIEEKAIDLVVASTHGHSGLGHVLLGSFVEKIVRHSPVPVLTYRQRQDAPETYAPRKVLVPFDFSRNAHAILPLVRFIAEHYDAEFELIHVVEPDYLLPDRFTREGWHDFLRQANEEARKRAEANFRTLEETELRGLKVRLELAKGAPHIEVVQRAVKFDLVCVSTHGWTGLKHFLLGSVAERIVRKAPCSVLTLRPPREKDGESDAKGEAMSGKPKET